MTPTLLASGAFAHVFDMGDGTVVKAYYRHRYVDDRPLDPADADRLARLLWKTEVRAYETLHTHAAVARFIPQFHGRADLSTLGIPSLGPKGEHVLGCGLRLEKISGAAEKISDLPDTKQRDAEAVLERIQDLVARINVWDASCFFPGSRAPLTVIDFAGSDDFGALVEILKHRGSLPTQTVRLLGLD